MRQNRPKGCFNSIFKELRGILNQACAIFHLNQLKFRCARYRCIYDTTLPPIHQGVALYIIRNLLRYIIKPQVDARWRVMRYSPTGADDIHDCVVMICQAYGNPQSSHTRFGEPLLRLG